MTDTHEAQNSAGGATRSREPWVDGAKGIAIILVVLFHAVIFLGDIGLAGPWAVLSGPLDTFRMPLFFFTAGIFARKVLLLPMKELMRARVRRLAWLYALWTTIWAVAFAYIPLHRIVERDAPVLRWAISMVWPNESTWFVYALAVYLLLGWVLVRTPVWVQLVLAGAISILFGSDIINSGNVAVDKIGTYFFFFMLAVQRASSVMIWATRVTWRLTLGLAALYAASAAATVVLGVQRAPGVKLIVGLLAVAAGVSLAESISRLSAFRWLTTLGQQTLPIYFLHFYVILGGVAILATLPPGNVLVILGVPTLVVLGLLIPLLVHRMTRKLTWLWGDPFSATVRGKRAAP